jgi:hypothetical protein
MEHLGPVARRFEYPAGGDPLLAAYDAGARGIHPAWLVRVNGAFWQMVEREAQAHAESARRSALRKKEWVSG